MLKNIHHIQLAMPKGGEDRALAFFHDLLGLEVVEKPPALAKRGGVWFEGPNIRLHLGVEDGFMPARKAHPAFEVDGLEALFAKLEAANVRLKRDADLPGFRRFFANDPFGNRIEFLEPL